MCFRDRTYCSQLKCTNAECSRRFTQEDHTVATEWWGGEDYPVALSDFKTDTCGYTKGKQMTQTNDEGFVIPEPKTPIHRDD